MSSVASVVRSAWRCGGPALLAGAGWMLASAAASDGAGGATGAPPASLAGAAAGVLPALALLACPGWGLLRVLSGVDRRFGVLGSSLCLSLLLLGLAGPGGAALVPGQVHAASLALALAGGVRRALFDRWDRRQPPHPAPMPLWPERLPACLALIVVALAALALAAPSAPAAPAAPAARAASVAPPAAPLAAGDFFHEAVAVLAAAGGLDAGAARGLVAGACLASVLLFAAEGISRLRGNRGAPGAMAALLLGCQPLGVLLALAACERPWSGSRAAEALAGAVAGGSVGGALRPFVAGAPLALSLAFAAMLLSSTLSVLRRASYHVPRLAAAAAFGLVLSLPEAAFVLLPGWILGVLWAHRMCRAAEARDPASVATRRRPGEPELLRAPFWALAVPVAGSGVLAFWLSGAAPPELRAGPAAAAAALALLAGLLPLAVLCVPGVRQLNASPGREAYLFVGLLLGAVPAGLVLRCADAPDFAGLAADGGGAPGDTVVRLLSLLLAVPVGNGALVLADGHGRRTRVALLLLALALLPGPLLLLRWASAP